MRDPFTFLVMCQSHQLLVSTPFLTITIAVLHEEVRQSGMNRSGAGQGSCNEVSLLSL